MQTEKIVVKEPNSAPVRTGRTERGVRGDCEIQQRLILESEAARCQKARGCVTWYTEYMVVQQKAS